MTIPGSWLILRITPYIRRDIHYTARKGHHLPQTQLEINDADVVLVADDFLGRISGDGKN
jgi:hypothetical protein